MKFHWESAYSCRECGNIDTNPLSEFCQACGSRSGHERVALKIRHGWIRNRIVEIRSDNDGIRGNRYISVLAAILELEVDGEGPGGPASYLAECMAEAALAVAQTGGAA